MGIEKTEILNVRPVVALAPRHKGYEDWRGSIWIDSAQNGRNQGERSGKRGVY